jgi:putative polyhydroxyalkanoate system protein
LGIDARQSGAAAGLCATQLASWRTLSLSIQEGKSQMADISITQQHQLSQDAARAAAQKVADKLASDYGLQCRWEGDVLRFERSGVEGTLALGERQAALRIKLGLLMGAFRSTIEAKVAESMRKTFAASA